MLPLLSILPYVLVSTTTMRWKPMIFITLMKATLTHHYSDFLLKNKKKIQKLIILKYPIPKLRTLFEN